MALPKFPDKDPADSRRYVFNWSALLPEADPIDAVEYAVSPDGLTKVDGGVVDATGMLTSIQLAGGTDGGAYTLTGRVTTISGIVLSRSAVIKVKYR